AIRAHGLTSAPIAGWTTPEQQVEDDLPRSDVGGKIVLLEGVFPLRGETHGGGGRARSTTKGGRAVVQVSQEMDTRLASASSSWASSLKARMTLPLAFRIASTLMSRASFSQRKSSIMPIDASIWAVVSVPLAARTQILNFGSVATLAYVPALASFGLLGSSEGSYNGMGKSATKTSDRLWEIGNLVNGLYKQLGVNVIMVKTLFWTTDPFTVSTTNGKVNASLLLDQFLVYRMKSLNDTPHTVAHLVSGYPMDGGLVGLASLGKLCHFSTGGGVNWDTQMNGSAYGVATTVAHELGHNLGMQHDDEGSWTSAGCGCPDPQGCMMQSAGGDSDPVRFSNCSVNSYLEYSVPNGLGYCMTKPPEASVTAAAVPTCGNRIVDPGEDCDCGLAAYCNNTCCNPTTCKFKPGATCASGQCCNINTCSVMSRGSVCRASRGVCDLPEYCNGTSEWCPETDDFLLDGTECAFNPTNSLVQAYCYNGECGSRDSRCSQLFVNVNRSATTAAAEAASTAGNETGYCDYRAVDASPLIYQYLGCVGGNQRCGTLYCAAPGTSAPSSAWLSMDSDDIRTISTPEGTLAMAMLDLTPTGLRTRDSCRTGPSAERACSVCRAVSSVAAAANPSAGSLPNCNGRGHWAQSRQCFCNAGFAPPDCLAAGNGGSASNQPAAS
uniref:Disintegrin domain-containing protein n=1 Tax=Macrostomum lignano TaxID=282301 RepID=A0A1I8IY26_9PLAT